LTTVLQAIQSASTVPQVRGLTADKVPDGTTVTRGAASSSPIVASVRSARTASAAGVVAALEVELLLGEIKAAILAAFRLRSFETLNLDGAVTATRISNFDSGFSPQSLNSRVNILTRRIDAAVADANVNGINLVSSRSRDIILRTTAFGGRVFFPPQPLDTEGLGLRDLDLGSVAGINDAITRLDSAITQVSVRGAHLEGVSQAFTREPPPNLPRGGVIDLVA
jgi:hypothetical protein